MHNSIKFLINYLYNFNLPPYDFFNITFVQYKPIISIVYLSSKLLYK